MSNPRANVVRIDMLRSYIDSRIEELLNIGRYGSVDPYDDIYNAIEINVLQKIRKKFVGDIYKPDQSNVPLTC